MSDPEGPEEADDPWLTVAEIADELRVNPATVRLWISKGLLPAMRVGMRKLLVRRSDLDYMRSGRRGPPPSKGYHPRPRLPGALGALGPPQSLSQLSTADIHGRDASPEAMRSIAERLRLADRAWEAAQSASENVPPAPGFASRIRALAKACDEQAKSLAEAGWIKGFAWTPIPGARDMTISTELRPGANRPGPRALWERFDRAVSQLGTAMEGHIMYVVAFRYQDLAAVMHEIAEVLSDSEEDAG
jgi:excisionase family DNA binding protein